MAEVPATAGAGDLDAPHAEARVEMLGDFGLVHRLVEAGPAAVGVELLVRGEELLAAPRANVNARLLVVGELAGERPLGPLLAQDPVLLRREHILPFGLAGREGPVR